jgi:hypothetical protein
MSKMSHNVKSRFAAVRAVGHAGRGVVVAAVLAAGVTGVARVAMGQSVSQAWAEPEIRFREINPGGFTPRGLNRVYGLQVQDENTLINLVGCDAGRSIGDSVTIAPPPNMTAPYPINGAGFAVHLPATVTNPDQFSIRTRIEIFDNFTGYIGGTFPGSVLLGTVEYAEEDLLSAGFTTYYPNAAPFPNNEIIWVPDTSIYVRQTLLSYQNPNLLHASARFPVTAQSPFVGTTDTLAWSDCDNNSVVSTGTVELNAGGTRNAWLQLSVSAQMIPPPAAIDLGTLADGMTTQTETMGVEPTWYTFVIPNDISDATRTFLDIDTEGSVADSAIALYRSDGENNGCLFNSGVRNYSFNPSEYSGYDRSSGTHISVVGTPQTFLTNAQLSFGIGRRAGPAGGVIPGSAADYDGRNGQLTAGRYYLCVAREGATFNLNGFQVDNGSAALGAFTIRLNTNVNSGALAQSDAPDTSADFVQDLGCLMGTGTVQATRRVNQPRRVLWYKFTVSPITFIQNGNPPFLDIDFSSTDAIADLEAAVFDSAGNLVDESDDILPSNKPAFSWGGFTPRSHGSAPAGAFHGQHGVLPGGTYYLAVSHYNLNGFPERFHTRTNSTSVTEIKPDFYFNLPLGCPPANDTCAAAEVIQPAATARAGSTRFANPDGGVVGYGCSAPHLLPDVFYSITFNSPTPPVTINTFGSNYQTILAVHTGCPANLGNLVACNGNFEPLPAQWYSQVTFTPVPNQQYIIRISGWQGDPSTYPQYDVGEYQLNILTPPPMNDVAGNAMPQAINAPFAFYNTTSYSEGFAESACEVCCEDAQVYNDLWYVVTTPAQVGTLEVNTFGSTLDTKLALYADVIPTAANQAVACNDDAPSLLPGPSQVIVPANEEQTFYIRVGSAITTDFGEGIVNTIFTPNGSACDSIDFNNDGVTPDTQDIEDFLSVFGGGGCSNDPNCNDIDFNNDDVSPDNTDLELFLLVYGGGTC